MEMDKKTLPEGWRLVKLSDVCEKQTGIRDPRLESEKTFRYIDISSVDNKLKRIAEAKELIGKEAPSRARKIVRENDAILSTTRPNLNAVAVVPKELDSEICSTGFCVLRSTELIDATYLFLFLRSGGFVETLSDLVKGALYPAVTDSQVMSQKIPLPPLPEQKRIAAILTERLAAVERARKASEARLEAARALPAAYLREVFESEEARGWKWLQLEEVASLLPSKSIATNGDAIVTAITSACLTESGFNPNGVKTAKIDSKDVEICRVSRGEVLIARSNTPELVGRVSVFDGNPPDVVASDLTIRIWPNQKCTSEFIGYFMSYLFLTGYWKENAGGASGTMKKITRTQVLSKLVPVPKIDVQNRLTTYLNSKLEGLRGLDKLLNDAHENVMAIPSSLLRQAFSGAL